MERLAARRTEVMHTNKAGGQQFRSPRGGFTTGTLLFILKASPHSFPELCPQPDGGKTESCLQKAPPSIPDP